MQKTITSLFILLLLSAAVAQPTITSSSMPSSGDTLRYSTASAIGVNLLINQKGASQTWDYSKLSPTGQDVSSYLSSLKTSYAFYFFNQIGLKTADSLGAGPLVFKNIYSFYTKNSSLFKAEGIGYSYSGIPLASNYSDDDEVYQFPLNYHDSDISTFKFTFTIPGNLFSYIQKGTRINYADAWGDITTPYKTYTNVMRLKIVMNQVDTLVSSFGKVPVPRKTVTYQYLSTSEKIPVLEIIGTETNGNFTATQIRYRDQYRGINNPFAPKANYKLNKTSGIASFDTFTVTDVTANPPSQSRTWSITPATAVRFVGGTSATSSPAKFMINNAGSYTVKLSVTSFTGVDDTTTNNQITIGANSIKDINSQQAFYPNPAHGFIHCNINGAKSIALTDLTGKTVTVQSLNDNNIFDISAIKAGLYIIKINTDAQVIQSKILIN